VRLRLLCHWLVKHFGPSHELRPYELAQALDVHRVIANPWFCGLKEKGYLIRRLARDAMSPVRLKAVTEDVQVSLVVPDDLRDFNPWRDTWPYAAYVSNPFSMYPGYEANSPCYPEMFIDKYYRVDKDEALKDGKPRVRPNGRAFKPLVSSNRAGEVIMHVLLQEIEGECIPSKKTTGQSIVAPLGSHWSRLIRRSPKERPAHHWQGIIDKACTRTAAPLIGIRKRVGEGGQSTPEVEALLAEGRAITAGNAGSGSGIKPRPRVKPRN